MSTRGSTKGLGKAWRPSRKGREELGDPPEGPGRVGRPSRRAGRGQEALPESQDGSGGRPRELGGPPGESGVVKRAGRGWQALLEGRECLGVSPAGLGWFRRPSWRVGRGREGRERTAGPPGGPGGFRRSSCRTWNDREALSVVREWRGGAFEGPGVVGRSLWMAGRSRAAFL